ncbi:MAG: hypothetical protein ACR2JO_03445 [Mycobacteriales bacterium]
MARRGLLMVVSAAQLGCGLTGLGVAIVRRHAYDLPGMHGDPSRIARDAVLMGTAFSAPVPMLLAQAVATAALGIGSNQRATRVLAVLGALMVPGYVGERLVRRRLAPAGWDRVESPLAAAGLGLAAAMAALGW